MRGAPRPRARPRRSGRRLAARRLEVLEPGVGFLDQQQLDRFLVSGQGPSRVTSIRVDESLGPATGRIRYCALVEVAARPPRRPPSCPCRRPRPSPPSPRPGRGRAARARARGSRSPRRRRRAARAARSRSISLAVGERDPQHEPDLVQRQHRHVDAGDEDRGGDQRRSSSRTRRSARRTTAGAQHRQPRGERRSRPRRARARPPRAISSTGKPWPGGTRTMSVGEHVRHGSPR